LDFMNFEKSIKFMLQNFHTQNKQLTKLTIINAVCVVLYVVQSVWYIELHIVSGYVIKILWNLCWTQVIRPTKILVLIFLQDQILHLLNINAFSFIGCGCFNSIWGLRITLIRFEGFLPGQIKFWYISRQLWKLILG
jgi:hypothetical protein